MKKFLKTVAALLLTTVMIVALFPSLSFAEEEETTVAAEPVVTVEETTTDNNSASTEGTAVGDVSAPEETPAPVQEPAVDESKAEQPVVGEAAPAEEAAPVQEPVYPENSIIAQPQDAVVAPKNKAVFTVETNGKVSSYQWQYSTNGGKTWKNLSSKTYNKASISITASSSRSSSNNGYKYRCVVTFKDKKRTKATSEVATLYVASAQSFKSVKGRKSTNPDVSADAPAGTFPTGTTMSVAKVDAEDYIDTINEVIDGEADVLAAVDISFAYGGEEVEPANDNKVKVTFKDAAVKEGVKLVHIDDFGYATEIAEEDIVSIKDGEIVFYGDAFSVYAVIEVDPNGGFDYDEVIGGNHVSIKAPEGAFEPGTQMVLEIVDDPDILAKAIAALDDSETYSISAIDISFWKDGEEVEPMLPVEVTWESADIAAGESEIIHIDDDGKAEKLTDADVSDAKAVFTASSFSTYTTTRKDTITVDDMTGYVVMNPSTLQLKEFNSGYISSTHPKYEGYTFKNATVVIDGAENTIDPVVYVGAFIYEEEGQNPVTYIYYRTESTDSDSDLIVRLARGETIKLNYDRTPYSVTYVVRYNNTSYTIGEDTLPSDLADMIVTGPDAVSENTTYDNAVVVSIPRGYSATVRMSNESSNQSPSLGAGSEPSYSCTDGWTVTPEDYPFTIDGVYTISNVRANLTVTINVTKRSSYTFNAQPAFSTAYFGGRTNDQKRYQNASPSLNYTFSNNTTTFTFTTRNYNNNVDWALDSFNINKQMINVPYVNSSKRTASEVTTLESGTIITLSATYNNNGTRTYEVKVENCYENITVTGGNLHNLKDQLEWVVQETTNISNFDYLAFNWTPLTPGEPMSFARETSSGGYYPAGTGPNPNATPTHYYWAGGSGYSEGFYRERNYPDRNAPATHYNYRGSGDYREKVIRFKVKDGYINPQIRYITSLGEDQYNRVGDVTLGSITENQYHLVTSQPAADGYYYFSLKGTASDPGLLSVRAELARYGVSYSAGTGDDVPSDPVIPEFDNGGLYGDGTLRGYNIEDNDYIALNKSTPIDPDKGYIFLYYTIEGDSSGTHYAPSQKIPLSSVAAFGTYDSSKDEFVIPFVAHWEEITPSGDMVTVTVEVFLDDVHEATVHTNVPEGASIYIDIDSDTMNEIMDKYNWQLFYDEIGSDPFINEVTEETADIELRLYSKFYVYHSATNTLELHTTKELETGEGANRTIGTLNLAALTTEGYYYGGYYKDYLGAHVGNVASGKNLVKEAADKNNWEGTLATPDIVNLSEGGAYVIPEYDPENDGTLYDPVNKEGHLNYWTNANAFTTVLKDSSTDWFGDRGSQDTATLKTGGTGTAVTIARAGIYYLHEVPADYLETPKIATVRDNYGTGDITKMFILSNADLRIFRAGGVKIASTDKKGSFAKNFTLEKYDRGTGETVSDTKTTKEFFGEYGYMIVADGSSCLSDGTYRLDPYWITYDNVTIHGSDVAESGHVRSITVSGSTIQ